MGKQKAQPSRPYQGAQFGLQDQLLSTMVMGNLIGQNPQLTRVLGLSPNLSDQARSAGLFPPQSPPPPSVQGGGGSAVTANNGFGMSRYLQPYNGGSYRPPSVQMNDRGMNPNTPNLSSSAGRFLQPYSSNPAANRMTVSAPPSGDFGGSNDILSSFAPQGFTQAGQNIPGQMSYQPYQFTTPNVNFQSRTPYQFSNVSGVNVPDLYKPQYDIAARDITEQGQKTQEQLLADMNRRGLLTTGGATKAMMLQSQEQDRKLANLASQYSIEQGRSQLQEDQMRRQLQMQRETQQAEEVFRQQGATDEQAKFLASLAFNTQQAQAGQNLSGFQANLSGRQQAIAEEQLANLVRRQPLEDLFKLWAQQAQPTGPTQGSSGILGTLGGILGGIGGSLLMPGIGTAVGAGLGGTIGGYAGGTLGGY